MTDLNDSLESITKQVKLNEKNENDGNKSSIKDKCMKILEPPFVYFIVMFFVILGGLYYNQPCFVLSTELDPKTNKQQIDLKMLGMYSFGITALVSLAIYPYISKKTKKN